jgi:hypothetical protein
MKGKFYTPDEATRMLPLVSRIVANAKACARLIDRHEKPDPDPAQSVTTAAHPARAVAVEKLASLRAHLAALEGELGDIGWYLDSARDGVAKCYGERHSRFVYLTWTLGEPRVDFWFPLKASHLDRQPLTGGERVAEIG